MKMKLICIGKVLRLALSMCVLCAAPLMYSQSHVFIIIIIFSFKQLVLTFSII